MSTQKLRTPKGLEWLASQAGAPAAKTCSGTSPPVYNRVKGRQRIAHQLQALPPPPGSAQGDRARRRQGLAPSVKGMELGI